MLVELRNEGKIIIIKKYRQTQNIRTVVFSQIIGLKEFGLMSISKILLTVLQPLLSCTPHSAAS